MLKNERVDTKSHKATFDAETMRILLVQDTDWLLRNVHQQHHLVERLHERGHKITVIDHELLWRTAHTGRLFSKRRVFHNVAKVLSDASVTVIRPRIVLLPILVYASMVITYSREIAAQVRESPPDVIIGMYVLTNYLALRASQRNGIPFVFQVLEPNYEMIPFKLLRPIGKMLERAVYKGADQVVVINEELAEYAVRMGAHPDRISVIRAGIDPERFLPHINSDTVRQHYRIKKDETVLFFVGWLYTFSGLQEVMTELAARRDRGDLHLKLLIVGDGDALEELHDLRTHLGLEDSVILTGKQPYETVPEFIAAADICLLPAHDNEIMRHIVPIKVYEYMAMGKPVITTTLPGVIKEFGTDHGVLYAERPEDVVKKAEELIEAGTAKAHGEKARHFVQNSDWSTIVDQFELTLRKAVASQSKTGSSNKRSPPVSQYSER